MVTRNNILEFIKLSGLVNSQIESELEMGNGTLTKSGEISQKNLSKFLDKYSKEIQAKGYHVVDFTKHGLGKAVLAVNEYDQLKQEISSSARAQSSLNVKSTQVQSALSLIKQAADQLEAALNVPDASKSGTDIIQKTTGEKIGKGKSIGKHK